MTLRLVLIRGLFPQNFQSLEIIGDMYQDTEAFCHYSLNSPESNIIRLVKLLGKKIEKTWKMEKLREKDMEIMGEKLSDK